MSYGCALCNSCGPFKWFGNEGVIVRPDADTQECQVVAPVQLYFSWKQAVANMQVGVYTCRANSLAYVQPWRFVTTFCYFGPLSLDLAFHLFFVYAQLMISINQSLTVRMRYSRLLEENSFSSKRGDYVWMLVLCATFLLVRSS